MHIMVTDLVTKYKTKIVYYCMARQKNDGKGRLGGRAKGTPNKVTASIKQWLSELIDNNRLQIEQDLKNLPPKDRLQMLEKLMQYVIPKQKTEMEITGTAKLEREPNDIDLACIPEDILLNVADIIQESIFKETMQKKHC